MLQHLYVGTYTGGVSRGIYHALFDAASGKLTPPALVMEAANPSYLLAGPDGNTLYAALENETYKGQNGGSVAAYHIDRAGGTLTYLNEMGTRGKLPCHLSIDPSGNALIASNYNEGTATVFALNGSGFLAGVTDMVTHTGSGPNPVRQEMPHVHCSAFVPGTPDCFLVDLGLDRAFSYTLRGGKLSPGAQEACIVPPGAGCRHMVIAADGCHAYLVNELNSTVSAFALELEGKTRRIQDLSTLPEGFTGESAGAAIRISANGRFIYASNRGHDSIAALMIRGDGTLGLLDIYPCGGACPRDIQLDATGRYLFAANQESDIVTVFAVDGATGRLSRVEASLSVPCPVSVVFAAKL